MTTKSEYLGPHQVQLSQWIECAPFERLLGIEIAEARQGQATLTMPFRRDFANGGNMLHGGALVSLADTAAVMAMKSVLQPGTHFGTTAMAVTFERPVTQGLVTAVASVTADGERLWHAEVILYDDWQQQVMQMKATFKVSRRCLESPTQEA
ncbi:MAG: PaaI family thioesterase [Desulfuromonas sp.]|nr:PaaI family thioesterase [Desulfuromonas sp.]